ncbi:MAG: hypothetical protein CM1200mP20_08730 [Pseudomonadota bacterium]|nr:MAG: hypothetical protein CM1200mP20_08730 [Pseudomonadota bacterium]
MEIDRIRGSPDTVIRFRPFLPIRISGWHRRQQDTGVGMPGIVKKDSRSACSTIFPIYITAMSSHMYCTTPRSCEMKR